MIPAAIRYNNPGAQYPGPSARRFGSQGHGIIGGGHKIARFPSPMHGAAAQYDLLRRKYAGMPLGGLIRKWSGNNDAANYTNFVAQKVGIEPNTVVTAEMLRDPNFAVRLAQAKSQWETGGKFPLNQDQWRQAHSMAYGNGTVLPSNTQPQSSTKSAQAMPNQKAQPSLFGSLAKGFASPQFMAGAAMFDSALRGGGISQGAQMLSQAKAREEALEYRRAQAAKAAALQQQQMQLQQRRFEASQTPKAPWWATPDGGVDPRMMQYRAAGRPQTNVNVSSGKQETAYDKEIGTQYAKYKIEGTKGARTANRALNNLRVMEKALDDPGLYTGTGGNTILSLKKAAQGLLGVPVEGVGSGEVVQNLSKSIALGLKDNLPGPLSDSDRRFLVEMAPGLTNSPEGNRRIIGLGMLQKRYQIALAQAANQYAKQNRGRIDQGFDDVLARIEDEYAQQFSSMIGQMRAQGEAEPRSPTAGLPSLKSAQEYMTLPSGSKFVAPDGTVRVKP